MSKTSGLRREAAEVFRSDAPPVCRTLDEEALQLTVESAGASSRGISRVCVHDPDDPLHEMLLVLESGRYIRPHRNRISSKSFHMLEGVMDVLWFEESGVFLGCVRIGERGSGHAFSVRLGRDVFNCVIVRSEKAVYLETLVGTPPATEWADWAPDPAAPEVAEYRSNLDRLVRAQLG